MYEFLNDFLAWFAVYLNHLLNPSLMTLGDWIVTILFVAAAICFLIYMWKWGDANGM